VPWRCPACHTAIHHGAVEDRPRPNAIYRCHICRLELVFDADTGRLIVRPLVADRANDRRDS